MELIHKNLLVPVIVIGMFMGILGNLWNFYSACHRIFYAPKVLFHFFECMKISHQTIPSPGI
jgi:hypothetical protein